MAYRFVHIFALWDRYIMIVVGKTTTKIDHLVC